MLCTTVKLLYTHTLFIFSGHLWPCIVVPHLVSCLCARSLKSAAVMLSNTQIAACTELHVEQFLH